MIPRKNIIELTEYFRQYLWLVCIPFSIYFGSSIFYITQIKKEIRDIEIAVNEYAEKENEEVNNSLKDYTFFFPTKKNSKTFYHSMVPTIERLQGSKLKESKNWKNKMEAIAQANQEFYNNYYPSQFHNSPSYDLETFDLNLGNQYPALRPYFSTKMTQNIVMIFAGIVMSTDCVLYCRMFSPFIQKYGDSYYLYPEKRYMFGRKSHLKVNGEMVHNGEYTFCPSTTGLHSLKVEYTFWDYGGLQTIGFEKGLLVE